MRRGADAAPSRPRSVGLATLVIAGLCMLGFATSGAVAGQASPLQSPTAPTTTSGTPAPPPPVPDPKPAPKPDPKPARPKQRARPAPPPPPPPPVERPARRPITTTAEAPVAPRKPPPKRAKVVAAKPPAPAAAKRPRKRPRASARPRREDPPARRRKPAKAERSTPLAPPRQTLDLDVPPAPLLVPSESAPSIAIPAILPLFGLGLVLLLGASVASSRRVPWPELAEPLYAHRHNLATVGCGAIALALLWLNAAVLF